MRDRRLRTERSAAFAGFLIGVSLVVLALLAWRVPAESGRLGAADVTFLAEPTGQLEVTPSGPFFRRQLEPSPPGQAAGGKLAVKNRTGRAVRVRVRAHVDRTDLDRLLRVDVSVGDLRIFAGEVGDLRSWTRRGFTLDADERRRVRVRAWLPKSVPDDYRGGMATVSVAFAAASPGGNG